MPVAFVEEFAGEFVRGEYIAPLVIDVFRSDDAVLVRLLLRMLNAERFARAFERISGAANRSVLLDYRAGSGLSPGAREGALRPAVVKKRMRINKD
jgi:hypothetical protein